MNSQASTAETSHRRLLDDREYVGLDEVSGPIVGVSGIHNVGYNELAEIVDRHGTTRLGMTLEVSEGAAVIQVFEGTSGLKLGDTRVR
ncbi:MAG TPA: V-type ATP synthase subunit B, partial [Candidatus Hydrogenedentes bacterium]|nr:V-type ATP synthase subunit B [Candidatus Hydrogenedentota bacterium]